MRQYHAGEGFASAAPVAPATREADDLYAGGLKRVLDLLIVVAALPVALPVILLIAGLVALDGGRPFFGHVRVGRDGRPFRCWKIRTMARDAEARIAEVLAADPVAADEWRRFRKLGDDPRVTTLGAALRRTSLDELPQLLNVLTGEMSLVGPRPVTAPEMIHYAGHRSAYFGVRPGITGLWQVSGRSRVGYAERVRMDVSYQRRLSFWLDLRILARTALVLFRPTGL